MDVLLFCTGLLFKEKFSGIKSCSKQKITAFTVMKIYKSLFNLNVLIKLSVSCFDANTTFLFGAFKFWVKR